MRRGRPFRRWIACCCFVAATAGLPPCALAHPGLVAEPDRWWTYWNLDPLLLLNLAAIAALFFRGMRQLSAVAQRRLRWRAFSFALGMICLAAALVSPLDALSEALASAHMVQHMLLMTVAAPLIALSSPAPLLYRGLPFSWRPPILSVRRTFVWRVVRSWFVAPLAVWWLHALVLWGWHIPVLYLAALRSELVHDLQHLSFFAAAVVFWRLLIDPLQRPRIDGGLAVLLLFTTSLHATLLGAFMSFSPRAWYADYAFTAPAWGLTPLEDQQLAGFIMWVPACSVYAIAAAVLFVAWLERPRRLIALPPQRNTPNMIDEKVQTAAQTP